jgi:hypothetical protein
MKSIFLAVVIGFNSYAFSRGPVVNPEIKVSQDQIEFEKEVVFAANEETLRIGGVNCEIKRPVNFGSNIKITITPKTYKVLESSYCTYPDPEGLKQTESNPPKYTICTESYNAKAPTKNGCKEVSKEDYFLSNTASHFFLEDNSSSVKLEIVCEPSLVACGPNPKDKFMTLRNAQIMLNEKSNYDLGDETQPFLSFVVPPVEKTDGPKDKAGAK